MSRAVRTNGSVEVGETIAVGGRGSNTVRQAVTLAAFCFAYLAIVHYPNSFWGIVRIFIILLSTREQPGSGSVDIVASYIYIGLPALILFLALVARRERAQNALALAAKIVAGIAILIALADLLLTPFLVGTGGYVVFLIAASVLSWHLLVFGCATRVRSTGVASLRLTPTILLFCTPIVALMAWSLFAAVFAVVHINQIARDRPYCVARVNVEVMGLIDDGPYEPMRTLEGLRGTRLFTTNASARDGGPWLWFHAVLIVDGEKGREYWNWSISRMRFEPFHDPDVFIEKPTHVCQPVPSFLAGTPWL